MLIKVLIGCVLTPVILLLITAGVLYFDTPKKPKPLVSISSPFKNVDYSDMPPDDVYRARDGADLGYKVYPGTAKRVVVMIHGSSDDASGMHMLAKSIRETGATVYVPVLRGHGTYGRKGDIDYIGQLDDDLADLMSVIKSQHPEAAVTLLGFSSGGGFVFRILNSANEQLFDQFLLVSPALPYDAPTIRPNTGGWASVALGRTIILTILNRFHITQFNYLPILAFATSPDAKFLTGVYTFRMTANFGAPRDYLDRLAASKKPVVLLVGGNDELFFPNKFGPLLQPVRSDLQVEIVPDVGHIGMIVLPRGVAAIRQAYCSQNGGRCQKTVSSPSAKAIDE